MYSFNPQKKNVQLAYCGGVIRDDMEFFVVWLMLRG